MPLPLLQGQGYTQCCKPESLCKPLDNPSEPRPNVLGGVGAMLGAAAQAYSAWNGPAAPGVGSPLGALGERQPPRHATTCNAWAGGRRACS